MKNGFVRRSSKAVNIDGKKLKTDILFRGLTEKEVSLGINRSPWFVSGAIADDRIGIVGLREICEYVGLVITDYIIEEETEESKQEEPKTETPVCIYPESQEEIDEFIASKGYNKKYVAGMFGLYTRKGWKTNSGMQIEDWKAVAIGWARRNVERDNAKYGARFAKPVTDNQMGDEIERLRVENERVKAAYERAIMERDSALNQMDDMKRDAVQSDKTMSEESRRMYGLTMHVKDECKKLQAENERLKTECNTLHEKVADVEELRSKVKMYVKNIMELQDATKGLNEELTRAIKERDHLLNVINRIKEWIK